MKRLALACCAAVPMMGTASASDIYTGSAKDRPVYQTPDDSWTGPYIGIHGGWVDGDWTGPLSYDDHDPKWPSPKYDFDDSDKTIDADGWLAGGQIGYGWQLGNSVIGIEGDLSYMDASGKGSFLPYPNAKGSPAWEIKSELELFGTLRGRFGILATPDLLAYATGGLAFARVSSERGRLRLCRNDSRRRRLRYRPSSSGPHPSCCSRQAELPVLAIRAFRRPPSRRSPPAAHKAQAPPQEGRSRLSSHLPAGAPFGLVAASIRRGPEPVVCRQTVAARGS